jgi:hypothetical protein
MATTDLIASLALLCSLVSMLVAFLAYRRTSAIDVQSDLQIERFENHGDWWLVTLFLRNRSAISLTPTRLRISRPRSARLSAYLEPVTGLGDARKLPEGVRTAPLLKSIGEHDLAKLARSFEPDEPDELAMIAFVPKSTSRLISVEITVRRHDTQKSETYSAQAYLPLT